MRLLALALVAPAAAFVDVPRLLAMQARQSEQLVQRNATRDTSLLHALLVAPSASLERTYSDGVERRGRLSLLARTRPGGPATAPLAAPIGIGRSAGSHVPSLGSTRFLMQGALPNAAS